MRNLGMLCRHLAGFYMKPTCCLQSGAACRRFQSCAASCTMRTFSTSFVREAKSSSRDRHLAGIAQSAARYMFAHDAVVLYVCKLKPKKIVYLDMDNFGSFLDKITHPVPDTFIYAFLRCDRQWYEPENNPAYEWQRDNGLVKIHKSSEKVKNAADIALAAQLTVLDITVDPSVPFIVVSGDKAFHERARQLPTRRTIMCYDPHHHEPEQILQDICGIPQGGPSN